MRNVVYLVKNGIGFGHIRRALILAEALQSEGKYRPIVVSQANSLDLYRTASVRVVNFPLLHRVPSAITEDCYLEILDKLLAALDPAIVVEDTYPDARYGAIPSLRHVPRILVMRRLDGFSFDQLRERGAFARYREILIAQSAADFAHEGHSADSIAAVESSNRASHIGNIHYTPAATTIQAARRRYAREDQPLVVVNGGAGGDQLHDGYGDRLFTSAAAVANRLSAEGSPAKFVFVTGPYYAGRHLRDTANVTMIRFDPDLPALLAAADVAVIKPGNNALSEALAGHANLVLVPDASFMEGLDVHAARVVKRNGGTVVGPREPELDTAIRHALAQPPRKKHTTPDTSSIRTVIDTIERLTTPPAPAVEPKKVTLLVRDHSGIRAISGSGRSDDIPVLSAAGRSDESINRYMIIDSDPGSDLSLSDLVRSDTRMLISLGEPSAGTQRWLRTSTAGRSLFVATATVITPRTAQLERTTRPIAALLTGSHSVLCVIDVRGIEPGALLGDLPTWLQQHNVELGDLRDVESALANQLLGLTP